MPKVDLWFFPHHFFLLCWLWWNSSASSGNNTHSYVLILVLSNEYFFPYVGLDAHITCMRFKPACSRSRKKRAAALCPLCFHPKLPAKLAFAPYPLGFKFGYCILENKQSESTGHPIEVPLSSRGIQPFFSTKGSAASHGRIHPIFYKGTIGGNRTFRYDWT
jgi:hypothetical protein